LLYAYCTGDPLLPEDWEGLTNERSAQVIIGDKVPYHKYLRIHPVQALNGKLYRAALTLLEKLLGTSPWDDAH